MELKIVRMGESVGRVTARRTSSPKQGSSSAHRRRTRGGFPLLRLVWVAGATLLFLCPPSWGQAVDYWAPWVTGTTKHSATINWKGASDGAGSIDYARRGYYEKHQRFEKTVASETAGAYQHVTLPNLRSDTAYVYRVRPSGNEDAFGNRAFRTMPASGAFTFIVISDSQEGHDYTEAMRFKLVADAVARETDVLFVLHGGDNARFDDESRWGLFFQAADGMLAKFPIFTAIGNHEYHDINGGNDPPTGAVQYHSAYAVPLNYSFDCAGIRFVVLNTPDPAHANGDDPHTSSALAESQAAWLRERLQNRKLGTFTIHHHPIWDFYSETSNPDLQPWETLYHTYPISATFAGHTHNYQRYDVEGIPYFVVGNAGGPCADIDLGVPHPPWYVFGEGRRLGYLKVTVHPKSNRATAQEVFVASVLEDDSPEIPQVYDPPVIADEVTFRLKKW
jgi:acid phosphatase type 7